MRAAGCVLLATGLWLMLVHALRPRRRTALVHPSRRATRSFPPFAPVTLDALNDGGPLTPAELAQWRGIVAGLREWQREAL